MLFFLLLYSFEFLDIPLGARYGALRSYLCVKEEPFSLFYNPANMATKKRTFAMDYNNYLIDIQAGTFVSLFPYKKGIIGFGLNYFNYGKFEKNLEGEPEDTFIPLSLVPVMGYSQKIGKNIIGVNYKIIYWQMAEYTTIAIATDIGLVHQHDISKVFGIGIQNLGKQIREFYEKKEALPTSIRIGFGYYFKEINLFGDIILPRKELTLGIEYIASKILTLRFGYYSYGKDLPKSNTPLDILSKTALGIGLKIKKFLLNYSFTPMSTLGIVNQISLIY